MQTLRMCYPFVMAILAAACGSEVPVGTGTQTNPLGGLGEPPDNGVCDRGLTDCANVCVATDSDQLNCRACGAVCRGRCSGGKCFTAPPPPPEDAGMDCTRGLTRCGADCVDLTADPANCGRCTVVCSATQACLRGICFDRVAPEAGPITCAPGQTLCGSDCADLTSSSSNCGACGKACARGQTCVNSACN